ncbi:RagB/SusD family nutrient uptake outer membrane protein [Paraflavisolibacter sp. H34]|uniref:RagB/SusD family nutrient uptake outer membrane protein n=1 Tax=Huijunlia imazamoxiresistens TaxID=3127457 RepID=UPI00301ACEB4
MLFPKNKMMIAALVLLASCKKSFVELTSPTALPPENFYKTEADMKSALTGVYGSLRTIYNSYYLLNEMPSDNTQSYSESEAGIGIWDKMTWNAATADISGIWNNHYNTIAQCNLVLEKIGGVSFGNAATRAQYIAEAKFVRALMYFNLVRYFGGVPLVTKVITNDADAFAYNRAAVTEVFAQVEKDLKEAEAALPVAYAAAGDRGRVTSGAVKAFLGKVYLQQKNYAAAEAKLKEVTALSPATYELLPSYADVFSTANEYNKELLFSVQYSRAAVGLGEGSSFALWFAPQPSGNSIVSGGSTYSYNIGSLDLYRSFESGDSRKSLVGVFTNGLSDSTKFYYYTKKFLDTPPSVTDGENNWIVIRYSDVLLMLAEVLNEQGKTSEALGLVQKVRTRAGLTTDTGLDQQATRALVKKERRTELCFEGHRWPDLVRWNDYVAVMTDFKTRYNVPSLAITADKKLYPIPQRERSLHSKWEQNQGYQ